MKGFLDFLFVFQGIIGTLLGVTGTLITTHILKNTGNLRVRVFDFKLENIGQDEEGFMKDAELEKANYSIISFTISVYNPSEIMKHIDNIKISINDQFNNVINEFKLNDLKTKKVSKSGISYSEKLDYINCEGKHLTKVKVDRGIHYTDNKELRKLKHIYLHYNTKNGKGKHIKVM